MESTEVDANHRYHSVDIPESPVSQKQGNLTGPPRIVQDSSADIYNYMQEWNTQHLIGATVISEICSMKISHFNRISAKGFYPQGLKENCDKLEDVCNKLESIVCNLKDVNRHIEGVMKLRVMKKDFSPVFTTWKIEEYDVLGKQIYGMYEKELELKLHIKENIGHQLSEENVLLYQTMWIQQPYIDNLELQIEAMLKETNLRQ